MCTFASILQKYLAEVSISTTSPRSSHSKLIFQNLLLNSQLLTNVRINEQSFSCFALSFRITNLDYGIESFFRNCLQNFISSLIVAIHRITDLLRIRFPSSFKLLQSFQINLSSRNPLNSLVVEKGHLPVILVESLRKFLKIALSMVYQILFRQKTLSRLTLFAPRKLLYQQLSQNYFRSTHEIFLFLLRCWVKICIFFIIGQTCDKDENIFHSLRKLLPSFNSFIRRSSQRIC